MKSEGCTGCGCLVVVFVIAMVMCARDPASNQPSTPTPLPSSQPSASAPPSSQPAPNPIPNDVVYSIISENEDGPRKLGIKRSIDVRLNHKVSEDVLRAIALKLKASDPKTYERTFICYYLPGQAVGAGAWATTHFNPGLEVRILDLGQPTEQGSVADQFMKEFEQKKPRQEPARIWTDNTGKYHIKAAFMEVTGDKVRIRRENGRIITMPLERLSDKDKEWIREHEKTGLAKKSPDVKTPSASATSDAGDFEVDVIAAWTMAQNFVQDRLKAPSTASFGSLLKGDVQDPRKCVKYLGGRKYRVKGWVDSQNSFGAMVRADFSLVVQDNGKGNWSLVGPIDMEQR